MQRKVAAAAGGGRSGEKWQQWAAAARGKGRKQREATAAADVGRASFELELFTPSPGTFELPPPILWLSSVSHRGSSSHAGHCPCLWLHPACRGPLPVLVTPWGLPPPRLLPPGCHYPLSVAGPCLSSQRAAACRRRGLRNRRRSPVSLSRVSVGVSLPVTGHWLALLLPIHPRHRVAGDCLLSGLCLPQVSDSYAPARFPQPVGGWVLLVHACHLPVRGRPLLDAGGSFTACGLSFARRWHSACPRVAAACPSATPPWSLVAALCAPVAAPLSVGGWPAPANAGWCCCLPSAGACRACGWRPQPELASKVQPRAAHDTVSVAGRRQGKSTLSASLLATPRPLTRQDLFLHFKKIHQ